MLTSCYGMSVAQLLDQANQSNPNKEVIFDGSRRMTYQDLQTEATELASGLQLMGVQKGDRIAVSIPAWHEFIVIVFAIAKVGAILVPFNTRYREEEVEHIINDSGAKVALFTKEHDGINHLDQFQSIIKRVSSLEHLITVRFEQAGLKSYCEVQRSGKGQPSPEPTINVEEDIYAIIYTSGTTGKPKGAMLTHNNLIYCTVNSCLAIKANENDVFLHGTPYFHIMGLAAILRLVATRSKAVILEKYHPEKTLQLIEQEKITIHPGVPTLFILEMNHPNFKKYDLSSLRVAIMAGAPCPVEIIQRVEVEMGCPILVSYGMTETSPILTMTDFDDSAYLKSETVGKAVKGVKFKIVAENGQELPLGKVGEIVCQTPGLMKGYYNLPDKTSEVIDMDRWYYTGDLGTIDKAGYVRIVGRKKDLLIRGGYNIYPTEIEAAFYSHPAVSEVAVVGLPDTVLGEVSCAAVTIKPEFTLTIEELKGFIKAQVANYKVPDHIVMVEELPKTASGKIMKFALKDAILSEKSVSLR